MERGGMMEWNHWKGMELSSRKMRPDKRGRVSQDHPLGSGYCSSTYIALSNSALKASMLVKPTVTASVSIRCM